MSAINDKYEELREKGDFLGKPISEEQNCSYDKRGRYRHYERGSIFWHPNTGAHEVHGAIWVKWKSLGWYRGFLGYPVTDETVTPDNIGRYNHFQHGSIYWSPNTGAHDVHGAIRTRWSQKGWESSWIGYPETDEMDTPDGGRYNKFQRAYIVWTPESGPKIIAYGELADNTDAEIDFEKIGNTSYGNLTEFYENMKNWYHIDLRECYIKKNGQIVKNIIGWQFANFWHNNFTLNGVALSTAERLIIVVAQVLLMQWYLRDLKNHNETRRSEINRYFAKHHCFKRNKTIRGGKSVWSYNAWCSEFVSYVYKRAGIPAYLRKKQHFVCKGVARYEKIGWCMSNVPYFVNYFKGIQRYRSIGEYRNNKIAPKLGNYLCWWNGHSPTSPKLKGHSMLVLGFKENTTSFIDSQIYIVNGNVKQNARGSGSPEGSNKVIGVQWKFLNPEINKLTGVGGKYVHLDK